MKYKPLNDHLQNVQLQLACSAAASLVLHNGIMVNEEYMGSYEYQGVIRPVAPSTRFNIASVRKSYLGFAISLALYENRIASLDDEIANYLDGMNPSVVGGTTIRHLMTHTHGLLSHDERLFPPGTGWKYNNVGINMLIRLVHQVFGMPLAAVMKQYVFDPCVMTETGWCRSQDEQLIWLNEEYAGDQGSEANLFVSARELAYWGELHLNNGFLGGQQIVPPEVIQRATTNQSPAGLDDTLPRNGLAWWIQDKTRPISEIGSTVPAGSYQIFGITGCACLVIPEHRIVAVRMYNDTGSNPPGYDYLADIRAFGDQVVACALG